MSRTALRSKLFRFVSQVSATFVGCVLFAIGVSGIFGLEIRPIEPISFIAQPTELGSSFDKNYWYLLALVGVWLILFSFVRAAALVALVLIVGKWLILI